MNFDTKKALTRAEAVELIKNNWAFEAKSELIPLTQSLGRVSAKDIYSVNQIPVYRVSAFDGFAVKSSSFEGGTPDVSSWVKGTDYESADTGDDFPDEYDTVIAVEDLHYGENGKLEFSDGFEFCKGDGIREAASNMKIGDLLVKKGTRIDALNMASMATGGIRMVPVLKKVRVAFIPTGSELVPAGIEPKRGQNIDCNSILIEEMIKKWGAEPVIFPITYDDKEHLENVLDMAMEMADIVIINGGSSKGGEDYNSRLLEEKGQIFEHTVRAVPGRPVGMAVINNKAVINVPGPVLAAWLASDWFIKALVFHYYGIPMVKRPTVKAVLSEDIKKPPFAELLGLVKLKKTENGYTASQIHKSAGNAVMFREANGLMICPIGTGMLEKGTEIDVELLRGIETIE